MIARLLDSVDVVTVVFSGAREYTMRTTECRRRGGEVVCGEGMEVETVGRKRPTVVSVRGHGVVTKRADAAGDILERAKAAGSGFVWTQHDGNVSLVRAEQLDVLGEALAGAAIVEMRCGDEPEKAVAEHFFAEYANLRTLLRPSAAGSVMALAAVRKLRLPVLGIVFLALVVNMLAAPGVRTRHDAAGAELEALRRTAGQADKATERRREFLAEYAGMQLPVPVSFLCDRVAMVVPQEMTLTMLAVQPPLQAPESNRKTTLAENRVEIAGEASDAADVSDYVSKLSETGIAHHVRLASMERDRERGVFVFRIELEL
jgi:Tfp pilus assembly protein PilN